MASEFLWSWDPRSNFNQAQVLVENNAGTNGDGIHVRWGSSIGIVSTGDRQVIIRNNQRAGLSLFQHSQGILHGSNIIVQNNIRGLFADDGSSLQVNFATISGNSMQDVHLRFGARGTFLDIPDNTMETILCEDAALSRETAGAHSRSAALRRVSCRRRLYIRLLRWQDRGGADFIPASCLTPVSR
jgi:hypothetical protein